MNATTEANLKSWINNIAEQFGAFDKTIGRTLREHLVAALGEPVTWSPHRSAACDGLSSLLATADGLREFREIEPALSWRAPGGGRVPADVKRRVSVSELVGPNGMIEARHVRFGILFQARQTAYGEHSHAAEELYLVLAGSAECNAFGRPRCQQGEGAFIHHGSNQPHAITTNDRPLLAVWGWIGDIGLESYKFHD